MAKKSNGGKGKVKGGAGNVSKAASRAAAHREVDDTLASSPAPASDTDGGAPVILNTAQTPNLDDSRELIEKNGLRLGDRVRVIAGEWAHQIGPVMHVAGAEIGVRVGGPRGKDVRFDVANLRLA